MSLKNIISLVDKWTDNKLKGLRYEANQLEMEIIRLSREEIKEDLTLYATEDLLRATTTVKDLFSAYREIMNEGVNLGTAEVLLLSDIKGLKLKRQKWGLSKEDENVLACKEKDLRIIQLRSRVYNHLVNFNIPEAIELYCESEGSCKLEILIEIYKYIDEDGFNNLCERKTCVNE